MPTRDRTVLLLRDQARLCAAMGSPLYAHLLERAAADVQDGGVTFTLLEPHDAPSPRADALALRLMAAVHRLVLVGEAPELAPYYPSVGGRLAPDGAWPAFADLLASKGERLGTLVALPCQTNEVGRCAALAFGFLEVLAGTGLPLRLLEVGASAGLNLRFDHYRYGGGGASSGPADSLVDLAGLWIDAPPQAEAPLLVVERRGCDLHPIDPATAEGRLVLEASLWADQVVRFRRLRGALELAARVPAPVDCASVAAWLPPLLDAVGPGRATVVYHSIVDEYLPDETRHAFHDALFAAGARATSRTPLAWLRLEPFPGMLGYGVTLTTWPGGRERVVATSGAHGSDVRRA